MENIVYNAKRRFFAKIFELVIQFIISGGMRQKGEDTSYKGRGEEKRRKPGRVGRGRREANDVYGMSLN